VKKDANGDRAGFVPFLNTWLAGAIKDGTWGRLYAKHITPVSGDTKQAPKG
jgi:ABC-type amino acid transport substrate-binding protein